MQEVDPIGQRGRMATRSGQIVLEDERPTLQVLPRCRGPSSRHYNADYAYSPHAARRRRRRKIHSPTLAVGASLVRRLISGLSRRCPGCV